MKILAIRGCNLASLAGEFEIDLVQGALGGAGVFAIVGNTGAGKSTLLDALCVALFDRTPRLTNHSRVVVGRGEEDPGALGAQDVRTLLRRGASHGWAEVDFESGDATRYRARWSVRRARGQYDGTIQPQQVTLTTLDGGERLGGTKTETLEQIHRRLGLTFDQFRRSALLAQGEFATFLRADGKDRSELLERMTGTSIYTRLSMQAHLRASLAEQRLATGRTAAFAIPVLDDPARAAAESDRALAELARTAARSRHAGAEAAARWVAERTARTHALDTAERMLGDALCGAEAAAVDRAELGLRRRAEALRGPWEEAQRRDRELAMSHADVQAAEQSASVSASAQRVLAERQDLAEEIHAPIRTARIAAGIVERTVESSASRARATRGPARGVDSVNSSGADIDAAVALGRATLDDAVWISVRAALAPEITGWNDLDAKFAQHAAAADAIAALDRAQKEQTTARAKLAHTRNGLVTEHQAAIAKHGDAQRKADAFQKKRGLTLDAAGKHEAAARTRLVEVERLVAIGAAARTASAARDAIDRRRAEIAECTARDAIERASTETARATAVAVRAEREHSLAELRKAAGYKHARTELVDGEPCPLCGAEEHPWRDRGGFDDAIAAAKARLDESTCTIDGATAMLASLDARSQHHARELSTLATSHSTVLADGATAAVRWAQQLTVLGELSLVGDPDAPAAEAYASELHAASRSKLDEAKAARSQAEAATKAAADAQADVQLRQAELDATVVRLADVDRKLAELDGAIERRAGERTSRADRHAELGAELGNALLRWRTAVEVERADPRAVAPTLGRAQGRTTRTRGPLAVANETPSIDREAMSPAAAASAHAWMSELAVTWRTRAERVAHADSALAAASAALDVEARAAETAVAEHAARCVDATRRRADAIAALATAAAAFEHARTHAGFDAEELRRLLSAEPSRVEELIERIGQLERAVELAHAVVAERGRLVAEHAVVQPKSLEDAAEVSVLAAALATTEQHAARAAAVIAADDDARVRRAAALELLARAEASADIDRVLGEVIGSHDGKKFRSFAQSLTLDGLLEVANGHLEELAPRYQLERVPNHDLELQVIDRDLGEEVRSVQSLSGGESFLVSLALALGLSSMSAHDVRVRTLLIDEGFGTLDPATLDTALHVLDKLQAHGRQVGVISHVPQLKERVFAHVNVVQRGGGRSEVIVA
ncbi:MAG: AAA family ATPase [Deltaproteobacteria bacterium]|nr:AAA family ATPase [Deltaproteobacteria bacterium]